MELVESISMHETWKKGCQRRDTFFPRACNISFASFSSSHKKNLIDGTRWLLCWRYQKDFQDKCYGKRVTRKKKIILVFVLNFSIIKFLWSSLIMIIHLNTYFTKRPSWVVGNSNLVCGLKLDSSIVLSSPPPKPVNFLCTSFQVPPPSS